MVGASAPLTTQGASFGKAVREGYSQHDAAEVRGNAYAYDDDEFALDKDSAGWSAGLGKALGSGFGIRNVIWRRHDTGSSRGESWDSAVLKGHLEKGNSWSRGQEAWEAGPGPEHELGSRSKSGSGSGSGSRVRARAGNGDAYGDFGEIVENMGEDEFV